MSSLFLSDCMVSALDALNPYPTIPLKHISFHTQGFKWCETITVTAFVSSHEVPVRRDVGDIIIVTEFRELDVSGLWHVVCFLWRFMCEGDKESKEMSKSTLPYYLLIPIYINRCEKILACIMCLDRTCRRE